MAVIGKVLFKTAPHVLGFGPRVKHILPVDLELLAQSGDFVRTFAFVLHFFRYALQFFGHSGVRSLIFRRLCLVVSHYSKVPAYPMSLPRLWAVKSTMGTTRA